MPSEVHNYYCWWENPAVSLLFYCEGSCTSLQFLNSRPILKCPWILNDSQSPWIVLEKQKEGLEKFGIYWWSYVRWSIRIKKFNDIVLLLLVMYVTLLLTYWHWILQQQNASKHSFGLQRSFFLSRPMYIQICNRMKGPWIGLELLEKRPWKSLNFAGLLL